MLFSSLETDYRKLYVAFCFMHSLLIEANVYFQLIGYDRQPHIRYYTLRMQAACLSHRMATSMNLGLDLDDSHIWLNTLGVTGALRESSCCTGVCLQGERIEP